jgi:hypothetical protein
LFGLPAAIHSLPGWEAPGRARDVGLWGARLAGLGSSSNATARDTILLEAAAFNLAVALFDTVVDECPEALPPLASALHPGVLEHCLETANSKPAYEAAVDDRVALIPRLFGFVLGSAGERFRHDPEGRGDLARLLLRMYESELGFSSDPAFAKTLPVLWIGRLAGASEGSASGRMFAELAAFIARWDDAQDLGEDWRNGRYNFYLCDRNGRWSPAWAMLAGASRFAFPKRSARKVGADLETSLLAVLDAADHCGGREAVESLLADLVGGAV